MFTVQACWHFYSHRPAGLLKFLLSSSRRPVDIFTLIVSQACWQLPQPTHWVTFTVQACWHFYSHRPAGLLTSGTAYALGNVHSPGLLTFLLSSSRRPVDILTLIVPQACWHFYSHRPAGLLTFLFSSSRRPVDNWHSLRTGWRSQSKLPADRSNENYSPSHMTVNKHSLCISYHSVQASFWQKQWKLLTVPHDCWQTRIGHWVLLTIQAYSVQIKYS